MLVSDFYATKVDRKLAKAMQRLVYGPVDIKQAKAFRRCEGAWIEGPANGDFVTIFPTTTPIECEPDNENTYQTVTKYILNPSS